MADDGKLYPVFKPDIVTEMRKLIAKATIITPNYTEATLLTGRPYDPATPSMKTMLELCQQLAAMGPRQIIITSVPSGSETITVVSYDAQTSSFDECTVDRIPFSTCGTGDLFTSVLTGSLLQGPSPCHDSVKKATQFLNYANQLYLSVRQRSPRRRPGRTLLKEVVLVPIVNQYNYT